MDSRTFVGLLHFADGLLPVGAYAHSFGLESYTAAGKVRDAGNVTFGTNRTATQSAMALTMILIASGRMPVPPSW
jgi:urease accessory protein